MQERVKARSTSGQPGLQLWRLQKTKSEPAAEQKPQFPFKLENLCRGSKESHWIKPSVLSVGTTDHWPLLQEMEGTTKHRYLSLFKIGMFLRSWLHDKFHCVELYFLTDFNKTVENAFQ